MTEPLTKEERKIVDRVRHRIREDEAWGDCDTDASELLAIIDNLSKRVVKKYSEEELQELCHKRLNERTFGNDHLKWRSFGIYLDGWVEFARFLGALEEK